MNPLPRDTPPREILLKTWDAWDAPSPSDFGINMRAGQHFKLAPRFMVSPLRSLEPVDVADLTFDAAEYWIERRGTPDPRYYLEVLVGKWKGETFDLREQPVRR